MVLHVHPMGEVRVIASLYTGSNRIKAEDPHKEDRYSPMDVLRLVSLNRCC